MKKLSALLISTTSLLTIGCGYDSSIKLSGDLDISINLNDSEINIPLKIESDISLAEGYIEINEITYSYEYDMDNYKLTSHFGYKGKKYPYNAENNSLNINGTEYYLSEVSLLELQNVLQYEYLEGQKDQN